MVQIEQFPFNPFSENTYVVYSGTLAWIVDPGNSTSSETESLFEFISSKNLKIEAILLTHAHIDHVLGLQACVDFFQVPVYLHPLEREILERTPLDAKRFGFEFAEFKGELRDAEPGMLLSLNQQPFEVLHVPGHSPGHVAYLSTEHKVVLSGDVLFQGSIGRTDLYKGDSTSLLSSISQKLFVLDPETTVFCGHGASTTIGFEKQYNPYF